MAGWLRIDDEHGRTTRQLSRWVGIGIAYAGSLPPSLRSRPQRTGTDGPRSSTIVQRLGLSSSRSSSRPAPARALPRQVACDMAAPPGNPVEVPKGWSQGYAVVIATIGEPDGRTKVYDPGYRADRYDIDVERVVTVRPRIEVPPGDAYATAYTRSRRGRGGVDRQRPLPRSPERMRREDRGGGARSGSSDDAGPGPARSVEGGVDRRRRAQCALDLAEGSNDATVATWQDGRARAAACGHRYDLAELEASFRDPALAPPCNGD